MVMQTQNITLAAVQFSKFYYRTFAENLLAETLVKDRPLALRALARVWAAEIDGKVLNPEFRRWAKALQTGLGARDDELNRLAVAWIGGKETPVADKAPAVQAESTSPDKPAPTAFKGLPITERQIEALRAALVEVLGPVGKALADRQRVRAPGNADVEFWIGELAGGIDDSALAGVFRTKAKKAVATA